MSSKTLYYCDKCGSEIPTSSQKTALEIKLNPYSGFRSEGQWENVSKYYDLCEACVEKLGFVKKTIVKDKPIITLTTADKLYDIISQMIEEAK